jgi:hypothetical protein
MSETEGAPMVRFVPADNAVVSTTGADGVTFVVSKEGFSTDDPSVIAVLDRTRGVKRAAPEKKKPSAPETQSRTVGEEE